jgi:hypothetical protein
MFTITSNEYAEMINSKQRYIEVYGKFKHHDGNNIWLELAGCDGSDSHLFEHSATETHNSLTEIYKDKIVRVTGQYRFDNRTQKWGYFWLLDTVSVYYAVALKAPREIIDMCGIN